MRDHLNQILATHEINQTIGHEVAMDRLRHVFDDIEDPPPGQETRKREVLYGFQTTFTGEPLYASLYERLKRSSKPDLYALHCLSERCNAMLKLIREHYEVHRIGTRILVFVDMRRTAKKLCECFRKFGDIRNKMNPQVIVGRGLCGDGLTIEEQQEILNDFRKGQTRLLVTTTILEEGLDVPDCNMVLRMKPPESLKQFVQSRGRACRGKDGKFIILCKDQSEYARQQLFLALMEEQAKVIKSLMGTIKDGELLKHERVTLDLKVDSGRMERQLEEADAFDDDENEDEELKEMVDLLMQDDAEPEQKDLRLLDEYEPEESSIKLKFVFFSEDTAEFYQHVQEMKNNLELLLPEVAFDSWNDGNLKVRSVLGTKFFPEATLTVKAGREHKDPTAFEKILLEVFMSDAFDSDDGDVSGPNFWISIPRPPQYFPWSTSLRLSLHRTHVGSLKTHKEFIPRLVLGMTSFLRIDKGGDKISIVANDYFHVESSLADLQSFVLVDRSNNYVDAEPLIHVYLTYMNPPRLSILQKTEDDEKEKSNRVICYEKDDTQFIFANCLTYKLDIPNPSAATKNTAVDARIQQVLRLLTSVGIHVYYTSVKTSGPYEEIPKEEDGLPEDRCPNLCHKRDVCYAMRCLTSCPGFVPERLTDTFFALLDELPEKNAERALYGVTRALTKNIFCNLEKQLREEVDHPKATGHKRNLGKSHAYLKRIVLTPTSIRFYEPDFMQARKISRFAFYVAAVLDESGYSKIRPWWFHSHQFAGREWRSVVSVEWRSHKRHQSR